VRICPVDDIKPGNALRVTIENHPIALVRLEDGHFRAIDDKCSHGEISLSEGFVEDETLECWAHGAKFDLNTGVPLSLPAYEAVKIYEVIIENDEVYIEYEA
jgi:3-phenylpropionate/trans-cinnamate dioxygenase ferredoxin subunit